MRPDLRLSVAKHADALFKKPVPRGKDICDLVADMMDASRRVLVQEPLDRRVLTQRVQQLDLRVRQLDEDDRHTVIRLVLRGANPCSQRICVLRRSRRKVRHRNGDMVEASNHFRNLPPLRPVYGRCTPQSQGRTLR